MMDFGEWVFALEDQADLAQHIAHQNAPQYFDPSTGQFIAQYGPVHAHYGAPAAASTAPYVLTPQPLSTPMMPPAI